MSTPRALPHPLHNHPFLLIPHNGFDARYRGSQGRRAAPCRTCPGRSDRTPPCRSPSVQSLTAPCASR
eukprot:5820665-Pyramimonas_sp.AAC.1